MDMALKGSVHTIAKGFQSVPEEWPDIQGFLSSHQDIEALMPTLRAQVSRVFGENSAIRLELQTDHTEGYQSLIARVRFDGEPEEALDLIDRLGENWWYAAGTKFHGSLLMNVETA